MGKDKEIGKRKTKEGGRGRRALKLSIINAYDGRSRDMHGQQEDLAPRRPYYH